MVFESFIHHEPARLKSFCARTVTTVLMYILSFVQICLNFHKFPFYLGVIVVIK